jgi:hypothetical protein
MIVISSSTNMHLAIHIDVSNHSPKLSGIPTATLGGILLVYIKRDFWFMLREKIVLG